jgi:hypothetical protein
MEEPQRTHICVDGGYGHCSHCGGSTVVFYDGPTVALCQWTKGCSRLAITKVYNAKNDSYVPACLPCAEAVRGKR